MTPRTRRGLLTAVVALGALESAAATCAYQKTVGPEDWELAREALASLHSDEPVFVGNPWLGPRARMELPALAHLASAAPADLRGLQRFHVLGLDDWSDELEADLEDLPHPNVVERRELGALQLTTYEVPAPATLTFDLLSAESLRIETGSGECRRRQDVWRCDEGTVRARVAEVDHRPRQCLVLDVADGTRVRLSAPGVRGNRLHGHVGFDDFNARLRSDGPVSIAVSSDRTPAGRFVVTDEQGWWPFAVDLGEGAHRLTVDVVVPVRGRWERGRYDAGAARALCLDLRMFEEAGA